MEHDGQAMRKAPRLACRPQPRSSPHIGRQVPEVVQAEEADADEDGYASHVVGDEDGDLEARRLSPQALLVERLEREQVEMPCTRQIDVEEEPQEVRVVAVAYAAVDPSEHHSPK